MPTSKALTQSIAVFGESGSGKTVLLSSFYGASQEPGVVQAHPFRLVAGNVGQGNALQQNYLKMKNSAQLPQTNRFSSTTYSFSIKLKSAAKPQSSKGKSFDALRLVWHDYPGEWFEQDVSGPEEAQRRVDTFKTLLGSDVAFLLVDGQKLVDNSGEEERYLKSLLTNFRNGLLAIKDDLLEDNTPLIDFPRIWVLALSKSDLLPQLDVVGFKELLIERVADEIEELRKVLAELVEGSDALSVGEDFVLLSSAQFAPGKIEVAKRVGVELILPMSAMLPFERHLKWSKFKQLPTKVAENLVKGVWDIAKVFVWVSKVKLPGPLGAAVNLVSGLLARGVLDDVINIGVDRLKQINAEALAKHDYLTATLAGYRLAMIKAEEDNILLTSQR